MTLFLCWYSLNPLDVPLMLEALRRLVTAGDKEAGDTVAEKGIHYEDGVNLFYSL